MQTRQEEWRRRRQRIVRLYEGGLTAREVGEKVGLSLRTIHRHLQQEGVTLRGRVQEPRPDWIEERVEAYEDEETRGWMRRQLEAWQRAQEG